MSIFTKIGHFFQGLFNAAAKAFDNLSFEQQKALMDGTGVVALINSMLDQSPAAIRAAIGAKFPNLDEAKLEEALFKLADTFGLVHMGSVEKMIDLVRDKLAKAEDGKSWAILSHTAASVIAFAFGPADQKFSAIVSLVEFVYQHFIKKSTGN